MSKMDTNYLDTIETTNLLTLEEYKYVYPRLMLEYIKLGADCNEMYFIKEQIEQHYLHIDSAKKSQIKISDDRNYEKYGTFEDWVKTARSFDIIIISLKEIIKFLKQKKQELKTDLQTKNQHSTPLEDGKSEARKEKEFLGNQITHLERVKIAKAIKDKYRSYKGKDFKILLEALIKLDLFPKKGKKQLYFRCLQNEGYNINNHQILEDKYFTTGTHKKGGDYEKSEDEIRRDIIIDYLETIINTK